LEAMTGTPVLWTVFGVGVVAMLALDLWVFNRHPHQIRMREAVAWSLVWIVLSLIFALGVHFAEGKTKAVEFLTGWVIEKSLSVDNLFVFLAIFSWFRVPPELQHRVLFYGVLGALVFRAIFVFVGGALLQAFEWMVYGFGGLLIVTAFRMLRPHGVEVDPEHNRIFLAFRRLFQTTADYRGAAFFVREPGERIWRATPLFLVLVFIEISDVMFAVDSVPAVFAVTRDTFIVYTSNVFAILGLRALYFVLAGMLNRFSLLHYGLALVLGFVGGKMILEPLLHREMAPETSLAIVGILIALSIVASWVLARWRERNAGA